MTPFRSCATCLAILALMASCSDRSIDGILQVSISEGPTDASGLVRMQETVYLQTDDTNYLLLANEGVTLVGFEGGAMLYSSGSRVRVRGTTDGVIIHADHIEILPAASGTAAPAAQSMPQ